MADTVKIENLHSFLASEGLEVVRAAWGPNWAYPVLYVQPARPQTPDLAVCGFCDHLEALHANRAWNVTRSKRLRGLRLGNQLFGGRQLLFNRRLGERLWRWQGWKFF